MKTIEAAYIMPIIFVLTSISVFTAFNYHDRVVSDAMQYGFLAEQAGSLENPLYNPFAGVTKNEIADTISKFLLIQKRPSLSASLTGDTLYLFENSKGRKNGIFFSNYEKCEKIRKEYAVKNLLR